ncbi:RhoGAP Rga8 [Schizosaccharomyces pombe]|uniref:Rho-GTPase-activating protein 8 n=1 Tax=Schizosaccharomyces pombe (strain 972 / ATCC 24843) TaxID=284812 RepID=RGA8_SCHPO|nr:putatiRho-type GTPase-activating protein Rga8 [Schizosaccharomyces pombe]Q09697.1 RecName: Full=Rho-GTPase-activating protein 8 [Schizosaccharomyces pombe 972h-]AAR21285.1 RhoGAP-like protein [Schizosaccharomyces pombe]CAA90505.2 Rho-type GTPase activating protein Rga8 [Schizosaccharomyces pombe]|eukprot:NP_592988.2 putatiRho-type GTPase-activating protein Rga8 [Schizosaccharomyces pombe]
MISSFSNGFWSKDYATGVKKLFDCLDNGVEENEQVKNLLKLYKEANEEFGEKLQEITKECLKGKKPENTEDGATSNKAFEGLRSEIANQGKQHIRIAKDLETLIIAPFSKMSIDHSQKLQTSQQVLTNQIKSYEKKYYTLKKTKSAYYNKCRNLEDYEEESKESNETTSEAITDLTTVSSPQQQSLLENDDDLIQLGFMEFRPEELKEVLAQVLQEIPLQDYRVPILGTYPNTCSGNIIVSWLQENLPVPTLVAAEAFGQDLIAQGFLRHMGVGGSFVNSTNFHYQWKDKAFQFAGLNSVDSLVENAKALPLVGEYLSDYISHRKLYSSETQSQRLKREVLDANKIYSESVVDLDKCRTLVEETIADHLQFLQKCETDRVLYYKDFFMDLSTIISNFLPSMKLLADQIVVYQEIIQPESDIRYILESAATGPFLPRVEIYEDYYNDIKDQIFGVDVEFLSHRDKKRVPIIVSTILSYLDLLYPTLASDEVRQNIWLVNSPLSSVHQLREALNHSSSVTKEVLSQYTPSVVIGVLKLYFLELPDSIVPSSAFELIRSIYMNHSNDTPYRLRLLQNLLSQLRRVNLATLSAIITHLNRLITLTPNKETFTINLANSLSLCISRPATWNLGIQHDKHPTKFMEDLLTYGPSIFEELRKLNSSKRVSDRVLYQSSATPRSTDVSPTRPDSISSVRSHTAVESPRSSFEELQPSEIPAESEFTLENVPTSLIRSSYALNTRKTRRNFSHSSASNESAAIFIDQDAKIVNEAVASRDSSLSGS